MSAARKDLPAPLPAAPAAGLTAAVLLYANLRPRLGRIGAGDDGEWAGSWTRRYGWPWTACGSFGYDPDSAARVYWDLGGVALNTALGILIPVTVALLARARTTSRP
jgi:hypothetical protein